MNPSLPAAAAILLASQGIFSAPAGEETGLFPAGPVPANHLKFYLQFPGPMERGDVFRHLRLFECDASGDRGEEVVDPFREVELWDETFTRLTLWLHPGRQKPGVNLNLDLGPVLHRGRHYQLVVSGGWRTETGEPLGADRVFALFAYPEDETQPDPRQWKISVEGDSLIIVTDDHLDPVTARGRIRIRPRGGEPLEPQPPLRLRSRGTGRPENPWISVITVDLARLPTGDYEAVVDPSLEDLAGNSIARPFNLDLAEVEDGSSSPEEPPVFPFTLP